MSMMQAIRMRALVLSCAVVIACGACKRSEPFVETFDTTAAPAIETWLDLSTPDTLHLEKHETESVSFDSESSRELLGEGWRDEEEDKSLILHDKVLWAASIVAELRLTVLQPRDLVLALEIQQHAVKTDGSVEVPPQEVDVTWNSTPVGTCRFEKEDGWNLKKFALAIPMRCQVSGTNTVTFASRYAVSPRQMLGEGNDGRSHAFGMKHLALLAKVASEPPEGVPEPKSARFGDNAIRQGARSRLVTPAYLPSSGGGALVFDGVAGEAGGLPCRVSLRADSLAGPVEQEVVPWRETGAAQDPVQFSLDEYRGRHVELVFETGAGNANAAVLWQGPRIVWWDASERAAVAPARTLASEPYTNTILIVLDALRSDSVDENGHYREVTPTINEIAHKGTFFTRAYAAVPYTCCSTWCIETSLYPFQHGAMGADQAPSAPKLSDIMRRAGIATGLVSANPLASHEDGYDEFTKAYEDLVAKPDGEPGLVTEHAVDFMQRHADKRFFLHLHYRQPHAPYHAPEGDFKKISYDPAGRLAPITKNWHEINDLRACLPTHEQALELRARYDENSRAVDKEVARIMETLKSLALADKTLVVITSDHGEGFGEHENVYTHTVTVYEPVIHVPLVLHGKDIQKLFMPRVEAVVSSLDIFPTVCALMGVAVPENISGESLMEKTAASPAARVLAFAQGAWWNKGALNLATNHWCEAYWWPRYKLIRDNTDARVELFDLANDRAEKGNLAMAYPVMTDYLRAQADAWKAQQGRRISTPVPCPKSEERVNPDNLKSLGYL